MPLPLDRLKGSIPPLITPFKNGEVDYDAYALSRNADPRRIAWYPRQRNDVRTRSLTTEERNRLGHAVGRGRKGRVPIVAATGSQAIWETRILTEHAATSGRDALADRHALLHAAAAARHDRVLSRSHEGHRSAVDDLSHPPAVPRSTSRSIP